MLQHPQKKGMYGFFIFQIYFNDIIIYSHKPYFVFSSFLYGKIFSIAQYFSAHSNFYVSHSRHFEWPTEAVVQRCSVKKVFLEISQNSPENTCAGVSYKKETLVQVFSCEFCEISNNTFLQRTPLVAASYLTFFNNLRFCFS